MDVEVIGEVACRLGEGPLWHPVERCLYWVDIDEGRLYRYRPETDRCELVHAGRPIGGVTYQADGSLLLLRDRGRVELFRGGAIVRAVVENIPGEDDTRLNDCVADPRGRVFCGTMAPDGRGRLYRLDCDGSCHLVLDDVGCPNGLGFTPDYRQLYFTESLARTIWLFDYDESSGALAGRRVFARSETPPLPDGLTVDVEGNVWSAQWDGGSVTCYAPDGTVRHELRLPTPKITSVTFGGGDFSELYVTSAGLDVTARSDPHAGRLFRLRTGHRGRAELPSRIGLT